MKRVLLIGVLPLLLSIGVLAGGYIRNDTDTTACAVEVYFSQPVTLTLPGGVFTTITADAEDPTNGESSEEFTIAGRTVAPGESVLLSWHPASAELIGYMWFPTSPLIMRRTSTTLPEDQAIENLHFANVFWWWNYFLDGLSDDHIVANLRELESAGFGGVSFDYHMFVEKKTSNNVYKEYRELASNGYLRTPEAEVLERVLELVKQNTNLDVEVRIQLVFDNAEGANKRGSLTPTSPSMFFADYAREVEPVIALCQKFEVEIFTAVVELDSLERYVEEIHRLLDQLDPLFDGWFSISQSTNNYIAGGRFDCIAGGFWGWEDSDGKPLIIGLNCNEPRLANSSDASGELMREAMIEMWEHAIRHYRTTFPGQYIWFGELAASRNRGTSLGQDATGRRATAPLALDEMKRVYYAMVRGAQDLGVDGYVVQYFTFYPPSFAGDNTFHLLIPKNVWRYIGELLE